MQYTVHEDGQIVSSSILYQFNEKDYDGRLRDLGQTFVKSRPDALLQPEMHYVLQKKIRDRPVMPIKVRAKTIKAGKTALLKGIPRKATVSIFAAGEHLQTVSPIDADELEFEIPVPCVYTVTFSLFPYQDITFQVEAVA